MAKESDTETESRSLVCPLCKEEFLTYSTGRTPLCPRCGKPVRTFYWRRIFRLLGLLLAAALVAGLILYFYWRLG